MSKFRKIAVKLQKKKKKKKSGDNDTEVVPSRFEIQNGRKRIPQVGTSYHTNLAYRER